jgi:hypothetical protein
VTISQVVWRLTGFGQPLKNNELELQEKAAEN